jgi:hypothetical protein
VKILATLELETLIELNKLVLSKKFKINDDLALYCSQKQTSILGPPGHVPTGRIHTGIDPYIK